MCKAREKERDGKRCTCCCCCCDVGLLGRVEEIGILPEAEVDGMEVEAIFFYSAFCKSNQLSAVVVCNCWYIWLFSSMTGPDTLNWAISISPINSGFCGLFAPKRTSFFPTHLIHVSYPAYATTKNLTIWLKFTWLISLCRHFRQSHSHLS